MSDQRAEDILKIFGDYGDPLTVLAEFVTKRASGQISDLAIPAYAFLKRWSVTLDQPNLMNMASYIQSISGYAGTSKDAVELAKAISLYDFLKGIDLKGGGS